MPSLPEPVLAKLFDRMLAMYGSRFSAMWADADIASVKALWSQMLGDLKPADLRRGTAALFHVKHPPTLPEFLALCAEPPTPVAPTMAAHPCLTEQRWTMTAEGIQQLAHVKRIVTRTYEDARPDGIAWARRLLANAKQGQAISAIQIAFAEDAIRRWEMTHHQVECGGDQPDELPPRVPSPHIYGDREPGSDDEELAS
ncbi:hypothetical protein [Caballeronia sp. ATUFL_F1_KS39]|uniref:hypothetical protein n=1 Tax=Caballeronia sp. ATUFL_F1_KS39 TaxID=2921766 RepID=UPI002027A5A7|nr:hypothetical protein [Caballeronia sp. ATUFL_F1_KS39]